MRVDDRLPDRASIRKVPPRHRLVDDARPRAVRCIALVEEASLEEPDLHGFEVAGRHDADIGQRIFGFRRLPAFDRERERRRDADLVHRQRRDRRSRRHARSASQPLDDRFEKLHEPMPLAVLGRRQKHLRGDDVAGLEARVYLQQLRDAARHQPRANEQDQRKRDLDHDQPIQQPARSAAPCVARPIR